MKPLRISRVMLPTLACWPQQSLESDNVWYMFDLQLKLDGSIDWFLRRPGDVGSAPYRNLEEALLDAKSTNTKLTGVLDTLVLLPEERLSIRLKVEKAIIAEERLMNEERWMLSEASRRHASDPRPRAEDLLLPSDSEALRQPLFNILQQFPYIHFARISRFGIPCGSGGATIRLARESGFSVDINAE